MKKRGFKGIAFRIVGVLLVFLLLLYVLLQLPVVQTKLVNYASDVLGKHTGATVHVKKVNFKFFKTLSLEEVFISDLAGDTLLYAESLDATLDLLDLFRKELVVHEIAAQSLSLSLKRNNLDSTFNFQYLVDYFASADTTSSKDPWKFDLHRIKIRASTVAMEDAISGQSIHSNIGSFSIFLEHMDLEKRSISIRQVGLGDSDLSISIQPDLMEADTAKLKPPITFPSMGWDLHVNQVRIEETDFKYAVVGSSVSTALNPKDLDIEDLNLFIDDLNWTNTRLGMRMSGAAFGDQSGFILSNLEGQVTMSEHDILLQGLRLVTPNSEINTESKLSFKKFDNLSHFTDSVHIYSDFINSEIDFKDLNLLIPGFAGISNLNTSLKEKISIVGHLEGNVNDLHLKNVRLNAKGLASLKANGVIRNLANAKDWTMDINLKELGTSYHALTLITKGTNIPEGLANWEDFFLSGRIKGNLKNLDGKNVKLETGSVTRFEGDLKIKGLHDINTAIFDIDVKDLRSISRDLDGFAKSDLPAALDSLGQFYYTGKFQGTILDFLLDGRLASDAGSMKTDVEIAFNDNYSDAEYSGDLVLDSFDLGKVFAISDLGLLTMDVNIFGNGLSKDVLRVTVLGEVQDLEYKGYHYRDLIIDGRFDKKQFAGHASVEDPNVSFDFEGVVNLDDSLSRFRFNAYIDTINFTALGFLETQLGVSGRLYSDFSGSNPDNMKGEIFATKLSLSNRDQFYLMDSLLIFSDFTNENDRSLEVRSPLVQGNIQGRFSPSEIPAYFTEYFNQYFPLSLDQLMIDTVLNFIPDTTHETYLLTQGQNFNYDWTFTDIHKVVHLLVPAFEKLDTLKLSGRVQSDEQFLSMQGYASKLQYDGMSAEAITLSTQGDLFKLDNVLTIHDAVVANGIEFQSIYIDVGLEQDTAYLSTVIHGQLDTLEEKISLAALVTADQNAYQLRLLDHMVLNGEMWEINPMHEIRKSLDQTVIKDLTLTRGSQQISIFTKEPKPGDSFLSSFSFLFKDFEIAEISDLLDLENANYDGLLNGPFTLRTQDNKINYLADLNLNDLTLQGERLGNLIIKSKQKSQDELDVLVKLEGGISGLDIRGTYNKSNSAIDFQGEVDRLELESLDPILKKYISGSQGMISGLVKVTGTPKVPLVDGSFELEKVSTLINYLQARYTFNNEDIQIVQSKMQFQDFKLNDQNNNSALLNGNVDFRDLADPKFNLKFNSSRFLILNTPPNSKDLFYGKLFVSADVAIGGSSNKPALQVNAKALDSTDFVLQPLISEAGYQLEDFIIFGNPNDYIADTTISIQDLYKLKALGIDITANLEITPNAQLTIVIDPSTGDKLVCRGTGNMAIKIDQNGSPNILGSYDITQGQYAFNFQRVLKRTFAIDPGSRVTFIGNILKSRFDITASYRVRTPTYELIRNQSTLSPSEENSSRQRSDVDVKLKLNGDLAKPIAKFDVEIKESSGAGATSSVSTKLSQLREDESSMNKQVFGLLIFNSFIAEEQTTSSTLLADAGQTAILSSVSSLLSNELNRLAKQYIKGVDLDFGVDSYSSNFGDGSTLFTELKVGLSKRLLNDRLTVKLGGNVQFENNETLQASTNNQNSTFSGDFILEYKLTEEGNYNLRFFQVLSNEENLFNQGANYSETGVSVFFTKSFNSKKYQNHLNE